jgi:hypothetical protein
MEYNDINGKLVSPETLEDAVDFTRKQYEKKRKESYYYDGLYCFDGFLYNIIKDAEENKGTFEDAVFNANDAFKQLK